MALDNSVVNNFSLFQFKSSQEVAKKVANGKISERCEKIISFPYKL
jgi:hypothetical protein